MTTMVRSTTARDGLLRLALRADAALSAAGGLVFLIAGGGLDSLLGPNAWVLRLLGVALVGYGAAVWTVATAATISRRSASTVIGANLASTVASVVVLIGGWLPLTTAGVVATLGMALYTTVFADLQFMGLRRRDR